MHDDENAMADAEKTEAPPAAAIPATEIVKKVKAAGKKTPKKKKTSAAKKATKKPSAPKKKAAPTSKSKAGYVRKGEKDGSKSKRGPKGNPPSKVVRNGDVKFGARIAKARHVKGWSQRELAVKAGITQPAVCNIERGTCGASEKLQAKLLKAVGL